MDRFRGYGTLPLPRSNSRNKIKRGSVQGMVNVFEFGTVSLKPKRDSYFGSSLDASQALNSNISQSAEGPWIPDDVFKQHSPTAELQQGRRNATTAKTASRENEARKSTKKFGSFWSRKGKSASQDTTTSSQIIATEENQPEEVSTKEKRKSRIPVRIPPHKDSTITHADDSARGAASAAGQGTTSKTSVDDGNVIIPEAVGSSNTAPDSKENNKPCESGGAIPKTRQSRGKKQLAR